MSTLPRSNRRGSRLVGEEHQIARFFSSKKYGIGDAVVPAGEVERFGMRTSLPQMDGYGNVQRQENVRRSRMEQLEMQKQEQRAHVVPRWDDAGLRGSIAAIVLVVFAVLLMMAWIINVSGLISVTQSNLGTKASIQTVTDRIDELTVRVEEAKADVDVAYQATGLGMIPASSTAVIKLSVEANAIIGPNGLASADTVPVIRAE